MSSFKQWIAILGAILFLAVVACEQPLPTQLVLKFEGTTMGTSYHITTINPKNAEKLDRSVDSLLVAINIEVNTYDSLSLISQLNRGKALQLPVIRNSNNLISVEGGHLAANLLLAQKPYEYSSGAFDPTVGPLTEYYGFGASKKNSDQVDQDEIDRLLDFVGFSNILIDTVNQNELNVRISKLGVRLDLSAIAKGYAVDQIANLLVSEFDCTSYFVEIGGETRTSGWSPRETEWTIGVSKPTPNASLSEIELIIGISNAAIATSGNYRNRRIIGGSAYVHTIDPQTGIAKASNLLSATVVANDCATADAFATACMASAAKAEQLLIKADLSGFLIFAESDSTFETRFVGNFEEYVLDSN
jgi:thiamine biosynthesis lipoprotein